jgi:radical SAM superfamily enzyme YgiQ (UPF0313 family)
MPDSAQHDVVLTTLNARYWHSAFGLRYLLANMDELRQRTAMIEFCINDSLVEVLAEILSHKPRIVGIGVYIWNVTQATELVGNIKRVAPHTIVVLGGPEVSYETEAQAIVQLADFVITGEADQEFADLCRKVLASNPPVERVIHSGVPQMADLHLPYELYNNEDIANRVIYVEASRGCPFTCEFCLSALEIPVRQVDIRKFLDAMQSLLTRGARQFKFVDRTFNLNLRMSQQILRFFLDRICDGLFLHFEMIPDRLPEQLRQLIEQFPAGVLQFEIGVQTFNDDVSQNISRPQDNQKLEDNFRFLREQTGVHIHADLIIGLPGEDAESFGRGFDRLLALSPQEIQVGILKRLKGTPIVRHDDEFAMVYNDHPPFEILKTRDIDFKTMVRLRHFARSWDLIGNSGNFRNSLSLMCHGHHSAFRKLSDFTEFLIDRQQRLYGISLSRLSESVFDFLVEHCGVEQQAAAESIWQDYSRNGRSDRPQFLRNFKLPAGVAEGPQAHTGPSRQRRHSAN